ncbi:deoxyguanosine kinase-like isoform X2 [Actinia tenebrosa]|uniref:Deoxyguanosine kinase-like isoform X2 n=1 Tax=Actinia tenebrosa TaxID=6105 RepID=A0A6P8I7I4_ACTTE|nr:deoxyguanosine kinase-like isoform X2 [Actinia tenebrosa]
MKKAKRGKRVSAIRKVRVSKSRKKMIGLARSQVCRYSSVNFTMQSSSTAKLIILEGNIGVGKTTLACQLARKLDYKLFLEPTTKNPYLAKFYEDPKRYALKLQLWIFRQRFRMYIKAAKHLLETGQGVLLDRSVFSDCVFADVNFQEGSISEEGYQYYNELKTKALRAVPVPHILIYIDASPETCNERIHGRGRDFEGGIPLAYLRGLDKAYKNMLNEMRSHDCKVLVYDWSDFGYQHEVSKDVKNTDSMKWQQDTLTRFAEVISDKSRLNQVLNLDYTIPEAEFTDVTDEECDTLQAEEHRGHKLETARKIVKQMKQIKESVIVTSE